MKDYTRIARKITIVLFLSQSLSSAGFIAAFTVNALVGVEFERSEGHGGRSRRRLRTGAGFRRPGLGLQHGADRPARGLALGQVLGVIGSVIAMSAVVGRSLPLFLMGLVLVGMARSAVDLGRFAAAEVHLPAQRGGPSPMWCWEAQWGRFSDLCWWAPPERWQSGPGFRSWPDPTASDLSV